MGSSLLFAAGLGALALAQGTWSLVFAWAVIGMAMGCGLYDAAFAALVRLHGQQSRGAITGVTLMAGFASTVGWPLSAWMASTYGWRMACAGWAVLHVALGLWLYASLPTAPALGSPADRTRSDGLAKGAPVPRRTAILLAFVFASTWFTSTAMAAHLPRVLQAAGATLAAAVLIGALLGPAQVAARLLEYGLLRRYHPLWSARLAALGHPLGVVLLAAGPSFAPAFAVLHGMGNGIMTIANGAVPLALFGAAGYGARQGWLMLPARIAQALAPFAFGLLVERWEAGSLWVTASLGVATAIALMAIRPSPQPASSAA